ncbi:MAG: hypothetical protein HLX50_20385 [Alteromonadaceae bacterium]|nr:hypothetical protein [Alteromonadaceae bacterium]
MIKIHFCHSKGIVGAAIRAITFSEFNHVAIELDGVIYHSTFLKGVHALPAEGFVDGYDHVETFEIQGTDEQKAREWLTSQLGAGYDLSALVALPFREDWQKPGRWFCSEFAAALLIVLEYIGDLFEESRIAPERLRVILVALRGKCGTHEIGSVAEPR